MSSSDTSLGEQRSVHQMLGGGLVADVILWRRRHVTIGILLGASAAWVIFKLSKYTLLSLVSRVLLLLLSILFLWAKAAGVLNRPPPPISKLHISEKVKNEAADFLQSKINNVLSHGHDVALGRDPKLFYKVSACLWLISVLSSWTDFLTLACINIACILTIPVLYEKYDDAIKKYLHLGNAKLGHLYKRLDEDCLKKVKKWIVEKRKFS